MKTPAGSGGRSPGSSDNDANGDGLRFSPNGVWRQDPPRPTPAQRRVLAELVRGNLLIIDQPGGPIRFRSGAAVSRQVVETLARRGWITLPASPAPLINEPGIPSAITETGRAAFLRGQNP